jgi:large subunit ribosomal protein L41
MFFSLTLLARAAKRTGFTKLTTKRARKGYYKGKGAVSTGRFTNAGRAWGFRV